MFFGHFPVTLYNPDFGESITSRELVTDIFFRTKFREIVKNQNVSYYLYTIPDGETPERLAYKYYGDATDHWIILYINDIVNPLYDWHLSDKNFKEYIKEKYGSIEYAQTNIHHYEKLIKTTDSKTGIESIRRYEIDLIDPRTIVGDDTLPYSDYTSLAVDYYPNIPGFFKDGTAITQVESRESISIFDWEQAINEKKRDIKVIRKEYYPVIKKEMEQYKIDILKTQTYSREIRGY